MTTAELYANEADRLVGVAYRLLGEVGAAQDAVQEAFLRLEQQDLAALREPAAWLTTVVSRICLDRLGSAAARREVYVGPWLPEPLVEATGASRAAEDPADRVTLGESVTQAFLVVLESLSPTQRVAFVLHDVFGHDHATVAEVLGMQEPAVRQLVSRARRAIEARRPRYEPDAEAGRAVADAFLVSCAVGEVEELLVLLAPDATFTSDGGGRVLAVRQPVHGAAEVARVLRALLRMPAPDGTTLERAVVNGAPGYVLRTGAGVVDTVLSLAVVDGVITAVHAVRNPDKLRHLPAAVPADAIAVGDLFA